MDKVESGFIPQFHKAANAGTISGGFGYISGALLPKSDVLIFSDTNHANAKTIYADLFSLERLGAYAKAGVSDIYVETPPEFNEFFKKMVEGKMTAHQFADHPDVVGAGGHLSESDYREKMKNLGDAVIAASKMSPPIKFYAAQISNTPEQNQALFDLDVKSMNMFGEAESYANTFFAEVVKRGYALKIGEDGAPDDIGIVYDTLGRFNTSAPLLSNEEFSNKINMDIYGAMRSQFSGRMPEEMVFDFAHKLTLLNVKQNDMILDAQALQNKFRIDNDVLLVKYITDTRNANGKAVVVHGAGHGAASESDLDEQLQNAGLKVNRVNVFYDKQDLLYVTKDNADINYAPKADEITFTDYNSNGRVDGTVHDTPPASPVVGNTPLSVKKL